MGFLDFCMMTSTEWLSCRNTPEVWFGMVSLRIGAEIGTESLE